MTGIFDSLTILKRLEAGGIARTNAEAIAETVMSAERNNASKADLDALRRDLEQTLTIRLGLMLVAAVAAVGTIAALL
jgi:hypothetical protein